MKWKIAVAGTYPVGTLEKLKRSLGDDAQLVAAETQAAFDALDDADIVLLRVLKMSARDIRRLPSLKAVFRWGAGFDTVDIEAAGKRGVYVCNTPGANAHAVVELVVLMTLILGRKVLHYRADIDEGRWTKNAYLDQTVTLRQKLVGIVGAGNIGCRVARAMQALGARTQYYDLRRLSGAEEMQLALSYVPLTELLRTSDIVTLHVPLLPATRHMIGAEQIAWMKDGALLINCARGGLMDDAAVLRAVETGKLSGAGIDTPEQEPPREDSGLRRNPNILLTPHIGGDVPDVGEVAVPMISENIKRVMRGETPQHLVNRESLIMPH